MSAPVLDLVAIGRSSVDLCGALDDAGATQATAESFARLVALWQDAASGRAP